MPPARRLRVSSRSPATSSAAAAPDGRGSKGWLSTLRRDSRIVAARNVLPPLAGKDGVGNYACTVLTAEDHDDKTTDPPPPPSYFRLIMMYNRHSFTAFRSYSSDEDRWSEEAKLTIHGLGKKLHRLGTKQMGFTDSGVVSRDGKRVYWMAENVVLVLSLKELQSVMVSLPRSGKTLLGLSPKGGLCAVQSDPLPAGMKADHISIRITTCTNGRWWDQIESIQVGQSLPADVTGLRLKGFCWRSGIVFFTAVTWDDSGHWRSELYALSLDTRAVEKLASRDGGGGYSEGIHGYEMDQVAYLASLA